MKFLATILILTFLFPNSLSAQKKISEMSWKEVATKQPAQWYSTPEAVAVAENVLLYQGAIGGWPKNTPFHLPLSASDKQSLIELKPQNKEITIDNGATVTELKFMAKMYNATKNEKYKVSFLEGLNYLLQAQYPNGGWPQFYPIKKGYYSHITFNDNAIINVMTLFTDISKGKSEFAFVENHQVHEKLIKAIAAGTDCILKTQYKQNGSLTAWCAQHDEKTLLPAKARAYELPSLSGSESAGIVLFLMSIENPSAEIRQSVIAAVKWFEKVKIKGIFIEEYTNQEGKKDRRVISKPGAPALWARFYELENNRPFFCDRDGIKKYSLAEIGYERRNGYSWYSDGPQQVLDKYQEWKKKWIEK